MASIDHSLSLTLFAFLLFATPAFCLDSPESSPSPSPSPALANSPPSPSPSPPPSDLSPSPIEDIGPSSDHKKSMSPSPAPDVFADDDWTTAGDVKTKDDSEGGKKAGITIGVIGAAACVVGVGAVVYKKRQRNIRRSQYSYVTRREIL
ncbi:hypothetical protein ACS0TY_020379 [Phlomoides rotata]